MRFLYLSKEHQFRPSNTGQVVSVEQKSKRINLGLRNHYLCISWEVEEGETQTNFQTLFAFWQPTWAIAQTKECLRVVSTQQTDDNFITAAPKIREFVCER